MTTQKTMTRVQLGAMGEALAVDHLTRMGLRVLHRNWRCRYGELDVIASDETTRTVVFVEVKTRTGDGFGGLAHAVTPMIPTATWQFSPVRRLAIPGRYGSPCPPPAP